MIIAIWGMGTFKFAEAIVVSVVLACVHIICHIHIPPEAVIAMKYISSTTMNTIVITGSNLRQHMK